MTASPCVVMLSANFHPYVGGAETQALELSKALRAEGLKIVVLTRRVGALPSEDRIEGVPVVRLAVLGSGLADSVSFMAAAFAWLLVYAAEYRAIHVHLAGSPAVAAALAGRILGKRVLVKLGGGRGIGELAASAKTPAGSLKLRLLSWLKPRFVAVTQDLVEELRLYGLGAAPVAVVPNGVDTGRFKPATPEERSRLRRDLGWPDGFCFLYVGRLAPEKRLDAFLEVFAEALRESGKDAAFYLAGRGPEAERLAKTVERLGLKPRVRFLGQVSPIERLYAAADAFVLPSVSEGLSNALLEAMASGLAVLASRVGGTKEAVRDGESGLLFAPEEPAEMRVKLLTLLRDPGLAAALGRRAREEAVSRYDLAQVAKRYKELYGI